MQPADKKPKRAPQPGPPDEEQPEHSPESATVLGSSLEDLASTTARDLPPPAADEGEVDPSLDGQATMMLDRAPPPPKRQSVKLRRPSQPGVAVSPPQAPAPVQEAEPEEEVDPNATMMLTGDSLPEAAKPSPAAAAAGAFSRAQAKESKEKLRTSKMISTLGAAEEGTNVTVGAANKGNRLVVMAALGVVAVVVLVAGIVTRQRVVPEQLKALYPYGFEGARGPQGAPVPGADEVTYTFVGSVDCDTHAECLRYRFEGQNFSGGMIIGRDSTGSWTRIKDEDLPFPATAPKSDIQR